ncbi:MAG: hypothetical protein ACOC04_01525 [Halothece sp.]
MSNEAKRITLIFSQEDVKVIKNRAKNKKLSFSQAAIEMIYKGIERDKHKETKIKKNEQRLQNIETLIKERESQILELEKQMEQINEFLATKKLGEIQKELVWYEDQPPEEQISIDLWYDCSDPNKKYSEYYGLTRHELIYKIFGSQGNYLFKKWCENKKLEDEVKQKNYLCKISGAKYCTVKLPGNKRESHRYVINHLFDTKQTPEKK